MKDYSYLADARNGRGSKLVGGHGNVAGNNQNLLMLIYICVYSYTHLQLP